MILDSCGGFLADCISHGNGAAAHEPLRALTLEKTLKRLAAFEAAADLPAGAAWKYEGRNLPSLRAIARLAAEAIDFSGTGHLGVMHGDLCFTNVLFDFRTRQIRVIDPRGTLDGATPTLFGDVRYDMARLNHSIAGAFAHQV